MKNIILLALLVAVFVSAVSAVPYMKIRKNHYGCLAEDLEYGSEVVVVDYKRRRNQFSDDVRVRIRVYSPVSSTTIYNGHAKIGTSSFSFRPLKEETGEYTVCFEFDPDMASSYSDEQHVDIHVAMDHHDRKQILPKPDPALTRQHVNNQEVFQYTDTDGQVKETLKSHDYLERLYVMLNDIMKDSEELKHECGFFEQKTQFMRFTSESTFTRVWAFSVLTMGAMVVVSWLQFGFLKSFLKRKKLV